MRPRSLLAALLLLPALSRPAPAPVPPPPQPEVRSWILMDQATGHVIASRAADEPVEPASLTKLMTAYAVFQALGDGRLALETEVPVSLRARRAVGSRTFLEVNSRVPVEVLLQGMIVQSGNDASIALAEAVAGSEDTFAALMNQYAQRLGMQTSSFENAHGLPGPTHRVSAADMARLARAIITEFPDYYRWYSQREFTWNDITQPNRNGLLDRDPSVDGMKTGHTDAAGYCLVASAERDGMRLISVVMGARSPRAREDAALALLNYGFSFFQTHRVQAAGTALAEHRIYKAPGGRAAVGLDRELLVTLPRGHEEKLEVELELAPRLFAPLTGADQVGVLRARLDGRVVAEAAVRPLADVPQGGFFRRLWDTILSWFA